MKQPHAPLLEHAADQAPAVALGRIFLPAEQGHPARPHLTHEPLDALLEAARGGHPIVKHATAGVIELVAFRAAPHRVAKVQVPDPRRPQKLLQRLFVELRGVGGVRARADIRHHLDAVEPEEVEKRLRRVVGMPDGEHGRLGRGLRPPR